MKGHLIRSTAAALCLSLVLGGCGVVEQTSYTDPPEVSVSVQDATVEPDYQDSTESEEEPPVTAAKSGSKKGDKSSRTTSAADSETTDSTTTAAKKVAAPAGQDVRGDITNTGGRTSSSSGKNAGSTGDPGSSGNSGSPGSSGGTGGSGSTANSGSSGNTSTGGSQSSGESGSSESTQPTVTTAPAAAPLPETTTVTTVPPLPVNPTPQELLDSMTLKQKVYQMFMSDPEHITGTGAVTYCSDSVKAAMEQYPVGGVVLFAKNLQSQSQTAQLLADLQSCSDIGLFTAVDEEGGTVARCAQQIGTTSFYNMGYYGDSNDGDTARYIGQTIGGDLSRLGFNLDFAPVADVNINPDNELGRRIFSSDPDVVANMAVNVAMGLQSTGVCATMKHFPGLGAEGGNTHTDSFVTIDRTVDELRETEFVPFAAGINAGVDFIMVGHQITTGFGDDLPGDLSYTAVTEYLRGELGFGGIIVSDSHQMNTIAAVYGPESAVLAIKAGVDIVLMPNDLPAAAEAVLTAVEYGAVSEERINESVYRILRKKYQLGLF